MSDLERALRSGFEATRRISRQRFNRPGHPESLSYHSCTPTWLDLHKRGGEVEIQSHHYAAIPQNLCTFYEPSLLHLFAKCTVYSYSSVLISCVEVSHRGHETQPSTTGTVDTLVQPFTLDTTRAFTDAAGASSNNVVAQHS